MKMINPNEYGSLMYDEKEENILLDTFKKKKIFRYASLDKSEVDIFEDKLKEYVNSKYSLGVINGTAGLITALIGAGVKENDRVLVSSYTFLATALAVKTIGAIPIPIEVDVYEGLRKDDLEAELKKGCKAVIIVELQGRCYDLIKTTELIKKYGAILIEDSCQGFGARYKDKYAGTIGDIGVYSFQQFKQISSGEGGAVVTDNKEFYDRMRNYSDMGSYRDLFPSWDSNNCLIGQNYRMNNLQAAILIEQMNKLDKILKNQRKSRDYILENIDLKNVLNSPDPSGDTGMNIILILDNYENYLLLKNKGLKSNIEIRKMWSGLYYDNELFKKNKLTALDLKNKDCHYTKELIEKMAVISIPPTLTINDCNTIIDFLNDCKNENLVR